MRAELLLEAVKTAFADILSDKSTQVVLDVNEVTLEVSSANYFSVCQRLRDEEQFRFDEMIDLCGMDYSTYGMAEWVTDAASETGFERAVHTDTEQVSTWTKPRFAAVVHLLSLTHNQRIRVRVFAEDEEYPLIPSITELWNGVAWFEREAFDLYGILFEGHADLRRILTDYGFVGHPFRKDFPLIGNVEMRYDATQRRCIYEEVSIEPRILVPRVIRGQDKSKAVAPTNDEAVTEEAATEKNSVEEKNNG